MAHEIRGNVFVKADPNEKEIIIPDGITTIASRAIDNLCKAETIVVPESVTNLSEASFCWSRMTSITLNANLKTIPRQCFDFCNKLKEIVLPDSVEIIEYKAFYDCRSLEKAVLSKNLKRIESDAFAQCDNLKEIIIPDSVETICIRAFYKCEKLEEIIIPDSVQELETGVFLNCSALKKASIPESCKVGFIAFPEHTEVVVRKPGKKETSEKSKPAQAAVTKGEKTVAHDIQANTLVKGDPNEKHVVIPDGIKVIKDRAFKDANLETVEIPESVTKMGIFCFSGAKKLKIATIRAKCKYVPDGAFFKCESLEEVILPEGLETIVEAAFSDCKSLKKISFPSGLKKIGDHAFADCTALTEIIIPDSVEKIGNLAFFGCKNIKRVIIPDSVKTIGEGAFSDCQQLEEISVPEDCHLVGKGIATLRFTNVIIRMRGEKTKETASKTDKSATGAVGKTPAKKTATKQKTKATGKIYRYDENISFDLPKGFDFTDGKDANGNRSVMIGVNPREENGKTEYDKQIVVTTVDADTPNMDVLDQIEKVNANAKLVKRYNTEPEALLICSENESTVLGVSFIVRIFALNIRISNQKALSLRMIGGGAGEGAEEFDQELATLVSVWPTVLINGEKVTTQTNNTDEAETIRKNTAKQNETKIGSDWHFEDHVLTIGNRWQMRLPSGWRVLEEEVKGREEKHLRLKTGSIDSGNIALGDTVAGQKAANEHATGAFRKLTLNGTKLASGITLRSDEKITVSLFAYMNTDQPGVAEIRIREHSPVEVETLLYLLLEQTENLHEAIEKIKNNEFQLEHPLGKEWLDNWTVVLRIAMSIKTVDTSEKEEIFRTETDIVPGIRCNMPKGFKQLRTDDEDVEFWYPAKGKPSIEDLQNNKYDLGVKIEKVRDLGDVFSEKKEYIKKLSMLAAWRVLSPFAIMIHEHIYSEGYTAVYLSILQDKAAVTVQAMTTSNSVIIRILTDTNKTIAEQVMFAKELCDSIRIEGCTDEVYERAFPATPELLREHYTLTESGRYTTHRNADFIGQPIRMLLEKNENQKDEAYRLMKIKDDKYSLDKEAVSVAKIFRLEKEFFEPYEDTEAMIRKGMFKNVRSLHVLRSLAWEIQSLIQRTGKKPDDLTWDELKTIGDLSQLNSNIIYDGTTYCAGLCGHYDWHVFYVPDDYIHSSYSRENDLRYLTGKENRGGNSITFSIPGIGGNPFAEMKKINDLMGRNEETLESLEALRIELEELLPVMLAIHDGFLKDRDRTKQLEGPLAEALAAWCALAIAAKEPFYSEEAADTPEADAALEGPLERPKDQLDDKPLKKTGTGKTNAKTTGKVPASKTKTTTAKKGSAGKTSKTESFYNERITFELPKGYDLEKEDDDRRIYYLNEHIDAEGVESYDYLYTLTLQKAGLLGPNENPIDEIIRKYLKGKKEISAKPYAVFSTEEYFGFSRERFGQVYLLELSPTEILIVRGKSEWKKDDREYLLDQYRHFIDAVNTMTVDGKPVAALNMNAEEMYDLVFELRGEEESKPETSTSAIPAAKKKSTAKKSKTNKPAVNEEELAEKRKEEEVRRRAADICDQLGLDLMGDLRIAECTNKDIEEVDIPYGVLTIDMYAFMGCDCLRKVILPESLIKIDSSAFENCHSLQEIVIPDSVTEIESSAFENCESLKKLKIPSGVKTISFGLCNGCTGLEEVIIPEGVTCIEDQAFNDCRSLRNVRIPDSIESIGKYAFDECNNLRTISIPDKQIEFDRAYTFPEQAEIIHRSAGQSKTVQPGRNRSDATVAQSSKPVKSWEHIESFDETFGFVLPTGYSLEWEYGEDGNRRCFIVYGTYFDENGDKKDRFHAQVSISSAPEDMRYGESPLQALRRINPEATFSTLSKKPLAELMVKAVPLNMLGRIVQLYAIWLVVEKNPRENFLVNFIGTWDDDRFKQAECYRHMINVTNALRINREPLPVLTESPEALMRKMPPVFDSNAQTIRGNVNLNISVNGQTVSQSTLYGDDQGNIHSRKRYTADMMPPGTDDPQAMADELNAMEPEKAEQMLKLMIGMNELNQSLSDLNDAIDKAAEDNPVQQEPQRYVKGEREERKQQEKNRILARISQLEKERDAITGIFAGMKKKKIKRQIDELKEELRKYM